MYCKNDKPCKKIALIDSSHFVSTSKKYSCIYMTSNISDNAIIRMEEKCPFRLGLRQRMQKNGFFLSKEIIQTVWVQIGGRKCNILR